MPRSGKGHKNNSSIRSLIVELIDTTSNVIGIQPSISNFINEHLNCLETTERCYQLSYQSGSI